VQPHATKDENRFVRVIRVFRGIFLKESPMCYRTPRRMNTWERTRLAGFFSTTQRAGQRPALPGVFSQERLHVRHHRL
jgi:hypothetical protein